MYFGEAKNLPGVKELLKPGKVEEEKKTRYELYRGIDSDYYGFRDEDDGVLLELEATEEEKVLKELGQNGNNMEIEFDDDISMHLIHLKVPSPEEIQKILVQRKKEELAKKYIGH
eukprot:TRINITY_DN2596_c0_g1_i3.p1 TRINITY_DN2596_c0_g1~~TRINITY_DN2596_c0_g1_i3.p1  ORF type:complete len:115 (-),score=49.48 TRINITY_DN2596_c0_g1_i3:119-463(-)